MARKKKEESNMTLVIDSQGEAGTLEDITGNAEKRKQSTVAESQNLALAKLTDDEKKKSPDFAEEKAPQPIMPVDVSWCEKYLKDHGLTSNIYKSGQVYVAILTDVRTGYEVVGKDEVGKPHSFGVSTERALINAIEFHKRLPASEYMPLPEQQDFDDLYKEKHDAIYKPNKEEAAKITKVLEEAFPPIAIPNKEESDLLFALRALIRKEVSRVKVNSQEVKELLQAVMEKLS